MSETEKLIRDDMIHARMSQEAVLKEKSVTYDRQGLIREQIEAQEKRKTLPVAQQP